MIDRPTASQGIFRLPRKKSSVSFCRRDDQRTMPSVTRRYAPTMTKSVRSRPVEKSLGGIVLTWPPGRAVQIKARALATLFGFQVSNEASGNGQNRRHIGAYCS